MELRHKDAGSVAAEVEEKERSCTLCKTTTTPMWRSGPLGPKSLCNACGIRYKKKPNKEAGDLGSSSPTPHRSKSPQPKSPKSRSKSPVMLQSKIKSPQRQSKSTQSQSRKRDKPGSAICRRNSSSSQASSRGINDDMVSKVKGEESESWSQVVMKRQRSRRRFGEVERAAVLLLSLSWESVSA